MSQMNQLDGIRRDQSPTRATKRRKISLACTECRLRKVKCDGEYPACGACRRRSSAACRYAIGPDRKRGLGNCVATLEKRLRALEQVNGVLEMQHLNLQIQSQHEEREENIDPMLYSVGGANNSRSRSYRHASGASSSSPAQSPIQVIAPENMNHTMSPEPSSTIPNDGTVVPHANRRPTSIEFSQRKHRNSKQTETETSSGDDETTDGVNSMMGAVEEGLADSDFYGTSSVAGFLKQVKLAVDYKAFPPEITTVSLPGTEAPLRLTSSYKSMNDTMQAEYVLPPRKMADHLLELYWSMVFPLYPYLDQNHVQAEYNKVWLGQKLDSDENVFMSMLNVIFALSSQISNIIKPEERQSSANAFFSRARGLLNFSVWESGSVDMIQCLLLMAQYLQSTDSAQQCWLITGTAIRHAQSLGLHMLVTIRRLQSPREQEIAARVWQACVMMDRVVAMISGRPTMISKSSGRIAASIMSPLAIADHVDQRCSEPSATAFFTQSLELYKITNDIILSLYSERSQNMAPLDQTNLFGRENITNLYAVVEFENELNEWLRLLPEHLQASEESLTNPAFLRQSIILKIRSLHIKMLLFRPVLLADLTRRPTETSSLELLPDDCLQYQIAYNCALKCVKVARELIKLIYSNITSDGSVGVLPGWWYSAFYTYTAATVLVAGRLHNNILLDLTEPELDNSWKCALDILQECQRYSPSLSRYRSILEVLHDAAISDSSLSKNSLGQQMQLSGQFLMTETLNSPMAEVLGLSSIDELDFSCFQDSTT